MAGEDEQYCNWPAASTTEIVEIGEESKSVEGSVDGGAKDVYVAVGKNDLHVLKWALDHSVATGSRVFLVHIFPPIAYIPTPVGRLSRSQLSKEQVQVYTREESNKRKRLLEKYVRMCNESNARARSIETVSYSMPIYLPVLPDDRTCFWIMCSQVAVDTMLVESNAVEKAILELIPVVNITNLVVGTKQSPFSRLSRKGLGKGEYIKKYAPVYCEVTLAYDGKKLKDRQSHKMDDLDSSQSSNGHPQVSQQHSERHFLECVCFSGKFN